MGYYEKHILVCSNQKPAGKTCCANSGGEPFFDYLKSKLLSLERHGPGKFRVSKTGCLGRCGNGPCIVIYPEGVWYSYSSFTDLDDIVDDYLVAGKPVQRLLISNC